VSHSGSQEMHGFLKIFSFFLALGYAKIIYNPQKSKVYTFSADPKLVV
jgi:hypothetical protein